MAKKLDFVIEGLTDEKIDIIVDLILAIVEACGGLVGASIVEVEDGEKETETV